MEKQITSLLLANNPGNDLILCTDNMLETIIFCHLAEKRNP